MAIKDITGLTPETKTDFSIKQRGLIIPENSFANGVSAEVDYTRRVDNKNGFNFSMQDKLVSDKSSFKESGIDYGVDVVEEIGDLMSSGADIDKILSTEYSKEDLDNGISIPESNLVIDKDTIRTMKQISDLKPEYLKNIRLSSAKELLSSFQCSIYY